MNCNDAQRLIDGCVDGELQLEMSIEVEDHIASCRSCRSLWNAHRELSENMHSADLRFEVPAGLEKTIRNAIKSEVKQPVSRNLRIWPQWLRSQSFAFGAAAIALFALFNWNIARFHSSESGKNTISEEVVSSHIRSLMAGHLFDVASTDQHTVKPWFTGKIDFSPPVSDLKEAGYPLVGGRLDYLSGHPVTALVYKHRKHVINLFIWPGKTEILKAEPVRETRLGFNISSWTANGMNFYAVSDVNANDLKEFSKLIEDGKR